MPPGYRDRQPAGKTWPCTRGVRCQKFAGAGTRNEFRLQPEPIKHHARHPVGQTAVPANARVSAPQSDDQASRDRTPALCVRIACRRCVLRPVLSCGSPTQCHGPGTQAAALCGAISAVLVTLGNGDHGTVATTGRHREPLRRFHAPELVIVAPSQNLDPWVML